MVMYRRCCQKDILDTCDRKLTHGHIDPDTREHMAFCSECASSYRMDLGGMVEIHKLPEFWFEEKVHAVNHEVEYLPEEPGDPLQV